MITAYSRSVLARFMSNDELDTLNTKYNANKEKTMPIRQVSDADFVILSQWKAGVKDIKSLARANGLSYAKVQTSLRLAALAELTK